MNYTLLKSSEQEKLERIRYFLKCFASHLWITKDVTGHIWPFTECHDCNEKSFCLKLRQAIEKEMN